MYVKKKRQYSYCIILPFIGLREKWTYKFVTLNDKGSFGLAQMIKPPGVSFW